MKRFLRTFVGILMAELIVLSSFGVTGLTAYAEEPEVNEALELNDIEPEVNEALELDDTELESYESGLSSSIMTFSSSPTGNGGLLPDNKIYGVFKFAQGGDQPATFEYSDAYFNGDSTEYNKYLAVFLQSVAMCAFNARTGGTTNYSNKYINIKNFLTECGYENYEHNHYYEVKPQSHSMGVSVAVKKVTLDDGTVQPIIAIACRGGNYESEWVGNVSIGAHDDAEGFGRARDIVVDFFLSYLDRHIDELIGENIRSPKIWICGYSRGSATANLTGNFFDYALVGGEDPTDEDMDDLRNYFNEMGVRFEDVFCYGFEVPMGLSKDSTYISPDQRNIWCIVDPSDPVPKVAPSSMGFTHAGQIVDPTEGVEYQSFMNQIETIDKSMANDYANQELRWGFKARAWTLYGFLHYEFVDRTAEALKSFVGDSIGEFSDNLFNGWLVPCLNATVMELHVQDLTLSIREKYAKYYQAPIAALTAAFMGSTGEDEKNFKSEFSNIISDNRGVLFYTRVVAAVPDAILNMSGRKALNDVVQPYLIDCLADMAKNEKITKVMPVSDIAIVGGSVRDISWLICNLGIMDFLEGFQHIATAIHYKGELFMPHNPEYVLAYLRAQAAYTDQDRFKIVVQAPLEGVQTLENVKINVYRKDTDYPYEKTLMATFSKNGLEVTEDGASRFTGTGKYTDNEMYLYSIDPKAPYYRQWFEVVCTDEQTQPVYVKVNFDCQTGGTKHKAVQQEFEDMPFPLMPNDVLQMRAQYNPTLADFTKYIKLTPKFVDENLNPIPDGTVKLKTNGSTASLDSVAIHSSNAFTVTPPEGYFYSGAVLMDRDGEWNILMDKERDKPYTTKLDNPSKFVWQNCSDDIYFICMSQKQPGRVYAQTLYQHNNGNSRTLIEEEVKEAVLKIENKTKGTSVNGAGSQYLEADPGDLIEVELDENSIPSGEILACWNEGDSRIKDGTSNGNKYSFTMPETGVLLTALLMKDMGTRVTLTYEGRWANPSGTHPTEVTPTWKLIYIDSEYLDISFKNVAHYYPTKHVYALNDSTRGGKAWVEAPSYASEESGDLVFDHWEAYETLTGKPWTDNNAYVSTYDNETNSYKKESICPNGYKEPVMALENIKKSITLVPVYEKAKYTLTVQYSTRGKKTFELEAGETIDLEDKCTAGYTHDYWSSQYKTFTETKDQYGQVTREYNDTLYNGEDYTDPSGKYTYTMPKGDAFVTAHEKKASYEITYDGDSIITKSGETVFEYNANVEMIPDKIKDDYVLDGVQVVSGQMTESAITYNRDVDGEINSFSFYMPPSDIVLKGILKKKDAVTLELKNATANYEDEQTTIVSPTKGKYYVFEGDLIRIKADDPADGKWFKEWIVANETVELTEVSPTEVLIQMPKENVSIEAVMDKLQPVRDITLSFTSEFAGRRLLPTSVFCTCDGIEETTAEAEFSSEVYWENPAKYGQEYTYKCTLTPKEGYYIDRATEATWNGKDCTITQQEDGTILVESVQKTAPAYITKVGEVKDVLGIKSGQSLDSIKGMLKKATDIWVNVNEVWEYIKINWDMDNLTDKNGNPYEYKENDVDNAQEFYVTGTLDLSSVTGDLDEFATGGLLFADGVSNTVKAKVTTVPKEHLGIPYVSSENLPGRYKRDQIVHLTCDSDNATIRYITTADTEKIYSYEELVARGYTYSAEEPIEIIGPEDAERTFVIWAVAVPNEGEGDRLHSEVVDYPYTIDKTSEPLYKVEIINGTGGGNYREGELASVTANSIDNALFTGFKFLKGSAELLIRGNIGSFKMPATDISMIAEYDIDCVNINIEIPMSGRALSSGAELVEQTPDAVKLVGEEGKYVTYTANGKTAEGTAEYNTVYTGKLILTTEGSQGFELTNQTDVFINGNLAETELDEDGNLIVTYKFDKTAEKLYKLKLVSGRAFDTATGLELNMDENGAYIVCKGQSVRVEAEEVTGSSFQKWDVKTEPVVKPVLKAVRLLSMAATTVLNTATSTGPDPTKPTTEFIMPEEDMTLTALYKTEIDEINLTLGIPRLFEELALFAQVETEGIADKKPDVIWTVDGKNKTGIIQPGFYLASIVVECDDSTILSSDVTANINGIPCSVVVSDERDGAVLAIIYSVDSARITEVRKPSDVEGIPSHTPRTKLKSFLPDDTTVVINGIPVMADIDWDMTGMGGYDPESAQEQTFTIKGTVKPIYKDTPFDPNDTYWADGVTDQIEIKVTIKAETGGDIPTGDSNNILLWLILVICSMSVISGICIKKGLIHHK